MSVSRVVAFEDSKCA